MKAGVGRVPFTVKLGYSVGNLGFGVVYQVVVSYLVFYATAVLMIPAVTVGLVVSIGIVWDAVTDPLMGYISDNTVSKRFGKRHLYMLIGAVGVAAANYLLWSGVQSDSYIVRIVLIACCLLLVKTFLTIYATPYAALGAELSDNYDERSSIQGWRTAFFLAGIMTALFVFMLVFFGSTPEYAQGQLNPAAYPKMGIAASVAMLVTSLISYYATSKYKVFDTGGVPYPHAERQRLLGSLRRFAKDFIGALRNRNLFLVVLGYLFTNIATAVASSIGLHVYTYTFGLSGTAIAILFGIQFICAIISQPLWVNLSKRLDKKPSVLIGLVFCLFCTVSFAIFVIFRDSFANPVICLIILSALLGTGTGGLFSLPLSMIADTVDHEEQKTGRRMTGLFYGLQTFSYKMTQSIIILVLGAAIQLIGFDASLEVQSRYTETGLGLILAITSFLAFLFALLSYTGYGLSKDKVLRIQKQLGRL